MDAAPPKSGGGMLGLSVPGLAVVPEKDNNGDYNGGGNGGAGTTFVCTPPQIVIEVTGPGSPQSSSRGGSGSGSLSPDAAQLEQALESRLGGSTAVVTCDEDEPPPVIVIGSGNEDDGNDGDDDDDGDDNDVGDDEGGGNRENLLESVYKRNEINRERIPVICVCVKSVDDDDDVEGEEERSEDQKGDLTVKPADLEDHDHDSGILCGGCLGSTASGSPGASLLLSSSSSSSNSSAASPYRLTPDVSWAAQVYRSNHTSQSSSPVDSNQEPGPQIDPNPLPLPPVPHEVMRTASERHQKGLMCPWVYQVLTQGEVKFGVCMEDESVRELPNAVLFFRAVRQFVYAILFNLHHHTFMARKAKEEGQKGLATEVPEIKIREWVYTKNNPYRTADVVDATPINWAVPTVQRLWFGSVVDDKKRRLRAFLSCMRSDSPLMLHTSHVPQHLLIMATVLRYIMSSPSGPVLRKQELDAFLVTAFSPDLTNAHYLQDLQLPLVTGRGAQLAALFMMGVETALFANDACGAPVPWLMCCPWLYFDGKLFHAKLIRANCARSLLEVCEGEIDLVAKVERCRQAVLEGLRVEFAHPMLPQMPGGVNNHKMGPHPPYPPGFAQHNGHGRGQGPPPPPPPPPRPIHQGNGMRRMFSRGGQLQVAGVVVGSWGPNYGSNGRPRGARYPAKRRTIKKRDVRSVRGGRGGMETPGNSRSLGMRDFIGMPEGGYNGHTPVKQDMDGLSPYPPHASQSHSSSGLKSPDSGVNVSILE